MVKSREAVEMHVLLRLFFQHGSGSPRQSRRKDMAETPVIVKGLSQLKSNSSCWKVEEQFTLAGQHVFPPLFERSLTVN